MCEIWLAKVLADGCRYYQNLSFACVPHLFIYLQRILRTARVTRVENDTAEKEKRS